MAPAIANIFMGWLEKRLLRYSPWNLDLDLDLWSRFIDDIFILWTHGKENLELFITWLNEQQSSSLQTMEPRTYHTLTSHLI